MRQPVLCRVFSLLSENSVLSEFLGDPLCQLNSPPPTDFQITECMMEIGGGFVKKIAETYRLADSNNQQRVKDAFADYWFKYAQLVVRCPECGSSDFIKRHQEGKFAVPECDFKECERCGHHWDIR